MSRPPQLLVVADVQTGYHHRATSRALSALEHLGRTTGAFEATLKTDSQLITRAPIRGVGPKYGGKDVQAPDLRGFDAIFMLPSGAGTLTPTQKADLLAFLREDGKGLILGHAALVAFFDWPEFRALIGGRMAGEVDGPAVVRVEDPAFPGAGAFGAARFTFDEQHAILDGADRASDLRVIMSLEPSSVHPRRPQESYPVVWGRREGAGRVLSVTWGHHARTWDDPRFTGLIAGGIRWAMGFQEPAGARVT